MPYHAIRLYILSGPSGKLRCRDHILSIGQMSHGNDIAVLTDRVAGVTHSVDVGGIDIVDCLTVVYSTPSQSV